MTKSDQSHEQHADGIVEAGNRAPVYFYLLFFGLIAWGTIFIGYYLFSGWSSGLEFEDKMAAHSAAYSSTADMSATSPAPSGGIDAGALFAANCAGCHGADGKGGFGSDLSSDVYSYGKNPEAVNTSITEGRGGNMPPFGDQLSAAEIDALVEYSLAL